MTEIQGPGYALYKKGEPINPAGQSPGIKKNNFKERVFIKKLCFDFSWIQPDLLMTNLVYTKTDTKENTRKYNDGLRVLYISN